MKGSGLADWVIGPGLDSDIMDWDYNNVSQCTDPMTALARSGTSYPAIYWACGYHYFNIQTSFIGWGNTTNVPDTDNLDIDVLAH